MTVPAGIQGHCEQEGCCTSIATVTDLVHRWANDLHCIWTGITTMFLSGGHTPNTKIQGWGTKPVGGKLLLVPIDESFCILLNFLHTSIVKSYLFFLSLRYMQCQCQWHFITVVQYSNLILLLVDLHDNLYTNITFNDVTHAGNLTYHKSQ